MSLLRVMIAAVVLSLMGVAALAQDHGHTDAAQAAAAHAGEHAHETVGALPSVKQGMVTGITAIIVFGIVAGVLALKVWPTITKALDERANKIRTEIEAAELAQEQAKAALKQYEKNLADARAEAQRMLEQTKAQQQALAADLKTKADAELAQLRERARRDIEAAKRAAIGEIYEQAVAVASVAAGKILQREVTAGDQRRLVEESLSQLQATARG